MRPSHYTLLVLLTGCGAVNLQGKSHKAASPGAPATSKAPGTQQAPADMMAADDASLPPCDAGHENVLIYVQSTKNFRTCSQGQWSAVDLTGPKGDAGSDEFAAALPLYKEYKDGVFRITVTCNHLSPYPASCSGSGAGPDVFLGSGFLCDTNTVCTNAHVALCESGCSTLSNLSIQALQGDSNSVNATGTPATPFFQLSSSSTIKEHPTKDLVKIPVTGVPSTAKVLPLTTKAASDGVTVLDPTLSMSFPLGFQDLYTDVGHVNAPYIGECDSEGGTAGYGCPSADYAFSTTNDTDHGSSGSPLIDINTGLVIGITAAGTDHENVNFTWAVDAYLLRDIQ